MEQMWELSTNVSHSDRDRRHSSSASSSSQSAEDGQISPGSNGSNGRRTRPSVSSVSSQLPTVREQKAQRTLSWEIEKKPSLASRLASDETVISSKDVLTDFRKVASRDPEFEKRRREKLERYRAENTDQRDVYLRLRNWADSNIQRSKSIMPSWIYPSRNKSPLPSIEELLALARHYYPPRVSTCTFLRTFKFLIRLLGTIASSRLRFW